MKKPTVRWILAFAILMLAVFCCGVAMAASSGECGDDLTWMLDEDGQLTISGTGAMQNYTYDSHAPWYANRSTITSVCINGATSIGDYAFVECYNLSSITIPDSITSIGDSAFANCSSLTSITIPDSVTSIGGFAFSGSSLTSITIPDSVTEVGDWILDGASSVETGIEIHVSSLEYWLSILGPKWPAGHPDDPGTPVYLYINDTELTNVTIPAGFPDFYFGKCVHLTSVAILDGVTSIGADAFLGCSSLTSITIPNSVTSIGEGAFICCSGLTSITIPGSVTSIGASPFEGCISLTSVTILDGATSIEGGAFYRCYSLTSVSIPGSVTEIGDWAFSGCSSLSDIYFGGSKAMWNAISKGRDNDPLTHATIHYDKVADGICGSSLTWALDDNGMLTISGTGAMQNYTYDSHAPWYANRSTITSVRINGATSIGDYAFDGCYNLSNFTLPDSITSIGDSAFYNCSSLTSITIPESVTEIGDFILNRASSVETGIEIHVSSLEYWLSVLGRKSPAGYPDDPGTSVYLFVNDTELTDVTIPAGFPYFYFENCVHLTSATILDGVTSISANAFFGCSSLANITIPNGVTSIGELAFYNCSSLTSITIPNSVTSIYEWAFAWCRSLTSISIPDGVTNIWDGVFEGCSSLTSVTIPGSVTRICDGTFYGCSSLSDIYFGGSKAKWNAIIEGNNDAPLANATIHYDKVADGTCGSSLTWALDDNGMLTISGTGAMTNFNSTGSPWYPYRSEIMTILIGDKVTGIGDYAFYNCGDLTSITIPDSVTGIGGNAFSGCNMNADIIIPVCNSYAHQWAIQHNFITTVIEHTSIVTDEAVEPTCAKAGFTEGSHCTACGEVLIAQETIPALDHTAVSDAAIEPTDTQPGLTEGSHCSVCGEVIVEQQTLHPLTWSIENTGTQVTIARYYGNESQLIIPSFLEGVPVRAIADGAFPSGYCPARVYIPEGVQSIGTTAFARSVTVYCHEYTEADYWSDERGYSKVYVDNTAGGTFYRITMPSAFTMEYGDTRELDATVWPLTGGETITITSSAPDVVSVDGQILTAVSVGQATITLRVGGKTGTVRVTVHAYPADFTIADERGNTGDLYIVTKDTCSLQIVNLTPAGAETNVTWTSSNEAVATISTNGTVTAKRPGTVTITATAQNGLARTYEITVCYPVTSISFEEDAYQVPLGSEVALNALAVTNGGTYTNKLISFLSSDETVATIEGDGVVSGVHVGTVTITASAESGATATTLVTVYCPEHHAVTVNAVPATCTETGLTEGSYCSVCGELLVEQQIVPMLPHTSVTDPAISATCTAAGLTEGSHCSVCGQVLVAQETLPALGHTVVTDSAVEPTCTEAGLTEGSHCSVCGQILTAQEVVSALGHSIVTDAAVEPTCTEPGLTEGSHCDRCGEVFTPQENIPALGHLPVTDPAVAPTCTETGLTEGSHCGRCGEILVQQEIISALGHTPATDAAVAPTCTGTGLTEGSHCTLCNEVLVPQSIVPALGHVSVIDSAIAPTCTEPGLTEGSHCTRCGSVLAAQETVDALGHLAVTDESVPASCTETGLTEGSHCGRCGEVLAAPETVPALGHAPVIDKGTPATCTESGITDGSHCERCGEILVAQEMIPAFGHSPVTDEAVAATCTETGLTEGSHCERCGEILIAQEIVEKIEHLYAVDESVPATCEHTGLSSGIHCESCGTVFLAQTVIPALGHSWSSEVTYTWSEDNTEVTASRICTRDSSHIDSETVRVTRVAVLSPTDTEPGTYEFVSDAFENEAFTNQRKDGDIIPALGTLSVMHLPTGLQIIDAEAFAGLTFQAVIISDSCTAIGSQAFAGCTKLVYVYIPASVTTIDAGAFDGCPYVIIDRRQ